MERFHFRVPLLIELSILKKMASSLKTGGVSFRILCYHSVLLSFKVKSMTSKVLLTINLVIGLSILSGCSQLPIKKPSTTKPAISAASKEALWKQRQRLLVNDSNWNLKSKVALRFRDENTSFGLNWAQRAAQYYVMQITNPITGGLVAKLSRDKSGVILLSDDGKTYRDNDEERLLQRQVGIGLPLKGMQYWVRGLASPQYKTEKLTLDAYGRPQSIQQAGWKINYSRYLSNKSNAMPRKVVISRAKDDVYLKMIAKQWQGI
jgi:outer membrane lipoprotein LolB